MLDSDASFFLVPEFQSSRGARRSRSAPSTNLPFGAATGADLFLSPMPDPGIRGVAAEATSGLSLASFMPGAARIVAGSADSVGSVETQVSDTLLVPAEPPIPSDESLPQFIMLAPADSLFLAPDAPPAEIAPAVAEDAATAPTPPAPDGRAITPRRPMRFTFARDTAEPGRVTLPTLNLFDGVFVKDSLDSPDIDPRLRRSRARALARLAAHEATLPPEARNLWFDDGLDAEAMSEAPAAPQPATPAPQTVAADTAEGAPPRRAVRHLSVTRRTPKASLAPAAIHDPLQDHLHSVRDALYAPLPEEDPATEAEAAAARAALPTRLLALLLGFVLLCVLAPMRAALARKATPSPNRLRKVLDHARQTARNAPLAALFANPLRMPARAAAITALVLVLAQTVQRDLM